MAWWAKGDFEQLDRTVISGGEGHISDIKRVAIAEGGMEDEQQGFKGIMHEGANTVIFIAANGLFPTVGVGPKGSMLKFRTLPVIGSKETGSQLLGGAVESNYIRFLKSIPANSKTSARFEQLEDGNYLFEATSPGRVPGSKALYQKWVSPRGVTYKMIKTTFGPDGIIIHAKSKL